MTGRDPGPLPTFLVIGAAKAGTTSLASYLEAHPDIYVAPEKELNFFDRHFDRGVDWYRSRFAGTRSETAIGEATPTYMYRPDALDRIASVLPDARLVVILRNPIDRAYSHYWWMRALTEDLPFADIARAEMRGTPPPERRYVTAGLYLSYLEDVCERFPREALEVVILEDLRRDRDAVFASVCRHVGVDDRFVPPSVGTVQNPAYRVRSEKLRRTMIRYRAWRRLPFGLAHAIDRLNRTALRYEPMDPALRQELLEYYRGPNDALATWLGRDLSAWNV